jgi:hypothetical protein
MSLKKGIMLFQKQGNHMAGEGKTNRLVWKLKSLVHSFLQECTKIVSVDQNLYKLEKQPR